MIEKKQKIRYKKYTYDNCGWNIMYSGFLKLNDLKYYHYATLISANNDNILRDKINNAVNHAKKILSEELIEHLKSIESEAIMA